MWIWIVSLIVLIACFIFAWRLLVSSYELPANKKFPLFKNFSDSDISYQMEGLRTMKSKLKALEDQSAYYELQFTKFQQRLKQLEENKSEIITPPVITKPAMKDEEDWKELYYEENEKKERLENELDQTQQQLEAVEAELDKLKAESNEIGNIKSDFDLRLNDIQSMQETIGDLQRQLEGAAQREKDLEIRLQQQLSLNEQYKEFETTRISLKSENEGLKRQMAEMVQREGELERKMLRLKELESKVSLYEEEKSKMIAGLEMMVSQSKIHNL